MIPAQTLAAYSKTARDLASILTSLQEVREIDPTTDTTNAEQIVQHHIQMLADSIKLYLQQNPPLPSGKKEK